MKIIDSHIHLDQYTNEEAGRIIADLDQIQCDALITVSSHLNSCRNNLSLAKKYEQIKPAFGFHPEQPLPTDAEIGDLFSWIAKNKAEMVAIGEVGLPYYLQKQATKDAEFPMEAYIEILEQFIKVAKEWDKPIVLHAVYEDAAIVCDLLEKHSMENAHFHWFKGDAMTTQRMIENGYYISLTPDVLYEKEIQTLVKQYPLEQMMVETDGPWRFKDKFEGKITHPKMIHSAVEIISELKEIDLSEAYLSLYRNSYLFYRL